MKVCGYSDFLNVLKNSTHSLPREFIILATQNIDCRIAFFVYLLLLDLAFQPQIQTHTVCVAQREIAKSLNVSLRTVKRAIAFLKQQGYLTVHREHPKKGGYQLNQIQVLFPESLVKTLLNPVDSRVMLNNLTHPTPSVSNLKDKTNEAIL
jgi:biotin operon repressor